MEQSVFPLASPVVSGLESKNIGRWRLTGELDQIEDQSRKGGGLFRVGEALELLVFVGVAAVGGYFADDPYKGYESGGCFA